MQYIGAMSADAIAIILETTTSEIGRATGGGAILRAPASMT